MSIKPNIEWIVIVMLLFFIIVAQAWKIYELEKKPAKIVYQYKEKRK